MLVRSNRTAEDGKSGEDNLFIARQTTQGRRNRHQDTERQTSPLPRASNDEQTPPERRMRSTALCGLPPEDARAGALWEDAGVVCSL